MLESQSQAKGDDRSQTANLSRGGHLLPAVVLYEEGLCGLLPR